MKSSLSIFFILFTIGGFTQNPPIFVRSDATWHSARTYPNGNQQFPSFVQTTTKIYGFQGDTLIGNDTWLKIYVTPDSTYQTNFIYLGCLNEQNGIVRFMDTLNVMDTLYNFNLQIGDSVLYKFNDYYEDIFLKVEAIDSLQIDGSYRKRFIFEEPWIGFFYINEIWIEGIGSDHGPLYPKYPILFGEEYPDSLKLTCYKQANNILWHNPFYEDCYTSIILNNPEVKSQTFKVYPNPMKEVLFINLPDVNTENCIVSIFDMQGKLVLRTNYDQNGMLQINVQALESKIYILQLETDNEIYRSKFIKTNIAF